MTQKVIEAAVEAFKAEFEAKLDDLKPWENVWDTEFEYYDDDEYDEGLTITYAKGEARICYYPENGGNVEACDEALSDWCVDTIREYEYEASHEVSDLEQFGWAG